MAPWPVQAHHLALAEQLGCSRPHSHTAASCRRPAYPPTLHPTACRALISACASIGRWQDAWGVFQQMQNAAETEPKCTPNTVTYSTLITA